MSLNVVHLLKQVTVAEGSLIFYLIPWLIIIQAYTFHIAPGINFIRLSVSVENCTGSEVCVTEEISVIINLFCNTELLC